MRALTVLRVGFGALVLIKAADWAVRAPDVMGPGALVFIAAWVTAGWAIALDHRRRAAALAISVLALFAFTASPELHNQHLYLFMWIPVVIVLTDRVPDVTLLFALRVQVSILYGFAALNKLTVDYLSGSVVEYHLTSRPLGDRLGLDAVNAPKVWVTVSLIAIASEALLAAGIWSRWRGVLGIGVAFHLGMLVMMARPSPSGSIGLAVFGGLTLLLYTGSFDRWGITTPRLEAEVAPAPPQEPERAWLCRRRCRCRLRLVLQPLGDHRAGHRARTAQPRIDVSSPGTRRR